MRDGEKLIITIPGKEHGVELDKHRLNVPRLFLREEVEGDFVAIVRVGGAFRPTGKEGYHRAGLVVTDGKRILIVQRAANLSEGKGMAFFATAATLGLKNGRFTTCTPEPDVAAPAYLRVERRGDDSFHLFMSEDGKKWTGTGGGIGIGLEKGAKVKVGVLAESTATGEFKAEFDQFQLSRPEN